MPNITEQLVTLALQPQWTQTPTEAGAELPQTLTADEQVLLKEKIICYIITPAPEEPEKQEPQEPTEPQPAPEEEPTLFKSAS